MLLKEQRKTGFVGINRKGEALLRNMVLYFFAKYQFDRSCFAISVFLFLSSFSNGFIHLSCFL